MHDGVVDLNADVGESFGRWTLGDDAAVLRVVTSANVACGFHAGDPATLRRTCALAAAGGVRIGAQVSYRDLAGFGRRFVDIDPDDLRDDVTYQFGALRAFALAAGTDIDYLKPHGALYHAASRSRATAEAIVAAVAEQAMASGRRLAVLAAPGSELLRAAARAGLDSFAEAFADRAYTAEGSLVPRSEPGSVIADRDEVTRRVVRMATAGEVEAVDGTVVPLRADSICVHGDTPGAAALAEAVRTALISSGVVVAAAVTGTG